MRIKIIQEIVFPASFARFICNTYVDLHIDSDL